MEVFKVMEQIGIKTIGDLDMFKRLELRPNETVEQGLMRYLQELGKDFKVKE